jgi:hypothetical protein
VAVRAESAAAVAAEVEVGSFVDDTVEAPERACAVVDAARAEYDGNDGAEKEKLEEAETATAVRSMAAARDADVAV